MIVTWIIVLIIKDCFILNLIELIIYMLNKNEQNSPDQGWKIHITAVPTEAQEELYAVSKYLINNNISFKFIPTIDKLIDRNSKNRSEERRVGKGGRSRG